MGPKVKCKKCNDVIQSKYTHHFVYCSCENVFVDGGSSYFRCGGDFFKDDSAQVWSEEVEKWISLKNKGKRFWWLYLE